MTSNREFALYMEEVFNGRRQQKTEIAPFTGFAAQ